jgi:hypothetical protein
MPNNFAPGLHLPTLLKYKNYKPMKTVKTRLFLSRRSDVLALLGRQLPVRDLCGGGGQVN